MPLFRIIPSLLLRKRELVKGIAFKAHSYVGDPINTIRIFNENGADELVVFDIGSRSLGIDYPYLERIASECFMPLTYGGSIHSLDQALRLFDLGIEKISLCTAALENPEIVDTLAARFGSQSIAICIDHQNVSYNNLASRNGSRFFAKNLSSFAKEMEERGAGEIITQNVERDGQRKSYNFTALHELLTVVDLPILIAGGAGSIDDIIEAKRKGASGAVAGSLFTFYGTHRAVLINYPDLQQREAYGLEESDWENLIEE